MDDFYSDTKSKPTRAMREVVLTAAVGDEQKDEDPTTSLLCDRVATLLDKESAVFLPSGTMCNEIAIRVHIRPGEQIICERNSHIVGFEGGGPAALSGAMIHALDGERGSFALEQVERALALGSRYTPRTGLLCVEQTANMAGGAIWPLELLRDVAQIARDAGVATHMDGARLMNAVVATGATAAVHASGYESVWIDFTKGLGAPVGAVLAGSASFIEMAWRVKQQIGGGMRQSGIVAAMCLHALDHHVDRLADDHALAQLIAEGMASMRGVARILPVETNIIIFDLAPDAPSAAELVASCKAEDIVIGAFGPKRIRLVTHLDVDAEAAARLLHAFERYLD